MVVGTAGIPTGNRRVAAGDQLGISWGYEMVKPVVPGRVGQWLLGISWGYEMAKPVVPGPSPIAMGT